MPRRKKHKTGIRTDAPHKLWHMDITVFRTADNVPVYIYILMDNFSGYILNWSISLEKKADTTFEMLKQAYFRYIEPEIQKHSEVLLLNDGGGENYGEAVTDFTGSDDNIIKQIRAQVDIEESNSMIEACNKTLKYSFLYHQKLPDFHALELYLPKAVYEYNEVKPHYAHRYLTPLEVLEGYRADPDRFRQQLKQARIRRISQHRNPECRVCVEN